MVKGGLAPWQLRQQIQRPCCSGRCLLPARSTCARSIVGKVWPQSPSISQLTSQLDPIPSVTRKLRHAKFQPHHGRHLAMHEGSELKLESAHGVHLLRRDVRTWNGVIVSVNDMSCSPGRAWHDISPPQNRMAIVLEQIGGRVEARTKINQPSQSNWSGPQHIDTTSLATADQTFSVSINLNP